MGRFDELYFNDKTVKSAISKPVLRRELKRKFKEGRLSFQSMREQNDDQIERLMARMVNGENGDSVVKEVILLRCTAPEIDKQEAALDWLEAQIFGE